MFEALQSEHTTIITIESVEELWQQKVAELEEELREAKERVEFLANLKAQKQ